MASAAVTASMAAAGFDIRNSTSTNYSSSNLRTPGSGTFPSALRSPSMYSPGFKEALKTPSTPPSAYLDFLKNNMSPALMSPMLTGTSSRFNFNEKPSSTSDAVAAAAATSSAGTTPNSQPALSRNTSYGSDASTTSSSTTVSGQTLSSNTTQVNTTNTRPESPRITIPPSPFVKPGPRSARTPRRLQIPQSPFSPAKNTTNSAQSPLSATPWSASFSPRDADPEVNGKPGKVSVRHVVTRTVTYCRTPLEPAPRGKRRKLEEPAGVTTQKFTELSDVVSEDETTPKQRETIPLVKQEVDVKDINLAPELRS